MIGRRGSRLLICIYAEGRRPGSVVTIHNLAFQGHFPLSVFWELGLPDRALAIDGVEYFGGVGYLKAGLQLADVVTTVSPTYAREILTPRIRDGAGRPFALPRLAPCTAFSTASMTSVWNPAVDPALAHNFQRDAESTRACATRRRCKRSLG